MNKTVQIALALISGLLLGISWPEITEHSWLVVFAFVPLYYLIDKTQNGNWKNLFLLSFLSFIVWHLLSVYWMIHSTVIGSISAWIINAFLMASVISFGHFTKQKLKKVPIEIILSFYWLSFEIMHLFWSLSWPWMDLGNVFANNPNWIQWYEYTGIYGGAFWILIINGLIFRFIKSLLNQKYIKTSIFFVSTSLVISLPLLLSYHLLNQETPPTQSIEISVIQPNIDTYIEKFNGMTPLAQSERIIHQLNSKKTAPLIVLPETAIPENFDVSKKNYPKSISKLLKWTKTHHKQLIGGFYSKDSLNYNSALYLEEGEIISTRHKQKLLPFGESMPFDWFYQVFQKQIEKDGGNSASFGRDQEARVFDLASAGKIGTLICFESAFPDITSEMARKGAQILLVITNDDWWQDTPGHRQHFAYSRLRAIENRRFIARSANTGISGFIDEKGNILQSTKYKTTDILSQKCQLISNITFFSQNESKIRYFIISIAFLIFLMSMKKYHKSFQNDKSSL
ncbi:apolipoprotein N-acyltransferase [Lentimicrobium sp. L6]|uniref:apolipoprotein N-acyltransferase n=1 Tax=Lentimicrobium sp. L6 TaxID=2735916 RepID=UPI0015537A8E|nr:apolipoprotein N-acyltransferase [Lentimicrobium sp. L6]NPD83143.1 apolipoprotein N-acyltransferase [Lentimicrobium sp. L6]